VSSQSARDGQVVAKQGGSGPGKQRGWGVSDSCCQRSELSSSFDLPLHFFLLFCNVSGFCQPVQRSRSFAAVPADSTLESIFAALPAGLALLVFRRSVKNKLAPFS
jgi:hypothetical protein